MFYEFSDDVISINRNEISQSFASAGYITLSELEETAEHFGFSKKTVMQCREDKYFHSDIEMYEDYYFAVLKVINAQNGCADFDKLAVYVKKNLFIVVDIFDEDCSVRDRFLKAIKHFSAENASVPKLLYAFFMSLTDGDSRYLEDTEFYISRLEKEVLDNPPEEDFNSALLNIKQMLLLMRNYYEQLIDLSEALEEDENELFDESELKYFRLFIDKACRLKDNVDMLRGSAVYLKEAYESSLELQLNKTMKIFTLFTVVFSPLNFIAAWYGMNFNSMAELKWKYGYAFVTALSLSSLIVIVMFFKKKRWI